MARGITENDVWTASDALLLEGSRPTIERVRQKIGRGSPNTVSPHLDTWFKNLGGRIKNPGAFSAPPDLPDPVQQAAQLLWEAALAETRRDFDQRLREGMAAAVSNVEAEKERAKLAEAAAFEALSKVTHLQAELAMRTGQLEQERLARAQAEAHFQDAGARLLAVQAALERAEQQAAQFRDAARRDAAEALERYAAAEARARLAMDAEQQARARAEKRADALDSKLDAAAAGARAAATRQAAHLAAGQSERQRLAVELATVVGERNSLQAEIRILKDLVAAEQQSAKAASAAGVAARSLLARLHPDMDQDGNGTKALVSPAQKRGQKRRRAAGGDEST